MATEFYYFEGECIWPKVQEDQMDDKYKRFSIGVFLDEASKERFNESGLQLQPKTDKETGKEFYQFARPNSKLIKDELVKFGVPHVFLKDGEQSERYQGYMANGSHVTVKVAVYDSIKGKGHRLESVRINKLIEYKPNDNDSDPGVDAPW